MSEQPSLKRKGSASDPPERDDNPTKKGKTTHPEPTGEHLTKGGVLWVEVRGPESRLIHVRVRDKNGHAIGDTIVPPELDDKKLYKGILDLEGLWFRYYMPGLKIIDVGYSVDGLGKDQPLVPVIYNFDD